MARPTGYHQLAELMGPYQEAAIFRRFGPLAMINLLSLQAELIELDAQFRDICRQNDQSADPTERNFSKYFRDLHLSKIGENSAQYKMILQIRWKLNEYYSALLQAAQVSKLSRPDKSDLKELIGWITGSDEGGDFLQGTELFTWDADPSADDQEKKDLERDMITLHPQPAERDPASQFVTARGVDLWDWLWRKLYPDQKKTARHGGARYYGDDFLSRLNTILASVVSSALPVVSIVVLYYIQTTLKRIGALVGLTMLFAFCLATFTNARRLEIFATTSTFAAVEVVFIGTAIGNDSAATSG